MFEVQQLSEQEIEPRVEEEESKPKEDTKEDLKPFVPMPKLLEKSKPKKRKQLKTREEAGAGKGQ